jgi:SAM-dependent methyltransferase
MALPEYEYKGLMAHSWDMLRGNTANWPDRFFFLEVIQRSGQPALDVGCGTGRLLLDYLSHGIDVDGVDNSPEMLALCREKAGRLGLMPQVYEQYMETLALPRTYRTIFIPSSSLQLIIERELADQAMQRMYAHLEPGGVVVAPFMLLWKAGAPLEYRSEQSAARPADGAIVRRVERIRYDPMIECEHVEALYQVMIGGHIVAEERHRRSPAVRSYTQAQARELFERAGLADIQLYSGFSLAPARPEDDLFTILGRRA